MVDSFLVAFDASLRELVYLGSYLVVIMKREIGEKWRGFLEEYESLYSFGNRWHCLAGHLNMLYFSRTWLQ